MKKISFILLTALCAFSCTNHDTWQSDNETQKIQINAAKVLGDIDPNQTWSSISQGTVTINADADLNDIVKVQILTESPFLNTNAKVLNEAEVTKGGSVTLIYDAPNVYSQLVAACIDSKGTYYIQVFNINDNEVSFSHAAKSRGTRASASEVPNITSIKLKTPMKSFNALRAEQGASCVIGGQTYTEWSGSNWENERMWDPSDDNTFDGGWKMDSEKNRGVIFRELDGFAEGEQANLEAIVSGFLYKYGKGKYDVNGKKNNIRVIRQSANFTLNNNYLITNGISPVTLIPVQVYTDEFKWNHIYYYYYKPENIPAGMDEVDYIKSLPKYKAIQVERITTTPNAKSGMFFRNKEFLLPFYGDGIPTVGENAASAIFPKGYRVGFLNMKYGDTNYQNVKNGCTYGDGRLNYAVNHIKGHFLTAMDKTLGGGTEEGMTFTDPRIAVFTANNKTYMCFEDGADCNFSDMIIEIGGGTEVVEEELSPEAAAYTMCFEDRPLEADYDMNDVVLQATRVNSTHIQLSIVACGAKDRVKIQIQGVNGYLTSKEVHDFFGLDENQYFVNTQGNGLYLNPVSETFTVDKGVRIEDFLKKVSVLNITTGKTIKLPEKGEPPYAIIVPINFQYPLEGHSITKAYANFLEWAQNVNQAGDWYLMGKAAEIYPDMFTNK